MAKIISQGGGLTKGDQGALITMTADAAQTITTPPIQNIGDLPARGVVIGVNITAITGTGPTLTVTLQGYDLASGQAWTLLASAALNGTGFTPLTIFPGAPVTANSFANAGLPGAWQVKAVIAGTNPAVTGTISASLLY